MHLEWLHINYLKYIAYVILSRFGVWELHTLTCNELLVLPASNINDSMAHIPIKVGMASIIMYGL